MTRVMNSAEAVPAARPVRERDTYLPDEVAGALTLLAVPGSVLDRDPDGEGVDDGPMSFRVIPREMTDARWEHLQALMIDRPTDELATVCIAEEVAVIEAAERVKAWADFQTLAALRRLRDLVGHECWEIQAQLGYSEWAVLSPEQRLIEANSATVDEVALATGLSEGEVHRRLVLAMDEDTRGELVLSALASGRVSLDRSSRIVEATEGLDPETANAIAERMLAPMPDGSVRSHRSFQRELRRQVNLHRLDPAQARADALSRRTAYGRLDDDCSATLTVTGDSGRVIAALDRVEMISRQLRGQGDPRTLENLRSDVALDLILTGWGEGDTGHDVVGLKGAVPAAHVNLVMSLSTMLGLDDAPAEIPGWGFVSAAYARQIAVSQGSVWRRLVTDPLTGAALDLSTQRYRPTAAMSDLVAAIDGMCRAPGCTVSPTWSDLDHETPWPLGRTSVDNLSVKHRRHHNHKTRRTWRSSSDSEGTITWTTLSGRTYITKRRDYQEPIGRPVTKDETAAAQKFEPPPF